MLHRPLPLKLDTSPVKPQQRAGDLPYALRGMTGDLRALLAVPAVAGDVALYGFTVKQACALFGVSRYELNRALHELGVTPPAKARQAHTVDRLINKIRSIEGGTARLLALFDELTKPTQVAAE
jgi:hypothetical protein